jgi:putative sugar O-methyltransferase
VISYRAPQALYQAWRIKQLLKNIKNPRVLEIGAGLGRTAYYAKTLGIDDYTIVDLPIVSMVSGHFLARSLGGDQVLFFEETAHDSKDRVKFLSPLNFLSSVDSYDLVINVDSLTEMDSDTAQNYLNGIAKNTKIFLSINHESNPFTVKELIDRSESTAQIDRFPYWMRRGYVEEVVRYIRS